MFETTTQSSCCWICQFPYYFPSIFLWGGVPVPTSKAVLSSTIGTWQRLNQSAPELPNGELQSWQFAKRCVQGWGHNITPKTNSLNPPKKMLFLVFYFQFWKNIFFRCQLLVSGRVFPCKPPFWMTEVKSHLSSAVCTYLGSGGVVDQRRACIKFRAPFG